MQDTNDVYCWGFGGWGQLGHGNDKDVLSPCIVEGLLGKGVRQIACGEDHTVAISGTNKIYLCTPSLSGFFSLSSPYFPLCFCIVPSQILAHFRPLENYFVGALVLAVDSE